MFVAVPFLIFMTYAQFQVGQVDKGEAQMNKLLEHGKEDESGKLVHHWTRTARISGRYWYVFQFIPHLTILDFIRKQRNWELKRTNKRSQKTVVSRKLFGLQKSDFFTFFTWLPNSDWNVLSSFFHISFKFNSPSAPVSKVSGFLKCTSALKVKLKKFLPVLKIPSSHAGSRVQWKRQFSCFIWPLLQ